MDYFNYQNDQLFCEQVSLQTLAEKYGTPLYVYSRATLERHWKAFDTALADHPHMVCYAVKANSNLAVLNVLARLGSGFDIVSKGELLRVLEAGGDASKVIFSGVGKKNDEIELALKVGIHCFNVESDQELEILNEIAGKMQKKATISFRVNPDVDAKTHPYISTGLKENKFGISFDDAEKSYIKASKMENITIKGIDFHIGSQLTELSPFVDAVDRLLALIKSLAKHGIKIEHMDLGGGLGVKYQDESPPLPVDWVSALNQRLKDFAGEIIVEPGRAIAGNAGILLSRVIIVKKTEHKNFAVIDAAMNDLMRPALYQAWQNIIPVELNSSVESDTYDVVGPICETGDFLGKDRQLSIQRDDLLAIRTSGAYGFAMSSNYNSRTRCAEVMVDGDQHYLIRERETFTDLIRGETILPE